MQPLRLPSEKGIGAAYDPGKGAVITIFKMRLVQMAVRMQAL
jgi:hypothetical protein